MNEAHRSGGHSWGPDRRLSYANSLADPNHLVATGRSTNRSKGDKDPANWLPPNRSYWCDYLINWIAIKREWSLSMDDAEAKAIRKGLKVCHRYEKRDHIDGLTP